MEVLLTTIASMFKPDERFFMHRYYSTRIAMMVCMTLIVVWFNYELLVNEQWRLDLLVIAGATAVAKIGAIVYYRLTD